jgi:CubicO group peptidase (beta-lactamase class C family)
VRGPFPSTLQGKLRLDDPVDGLLPELAERRLLRRLDGPLEDTVPAERAITVRDVLTSRMGFGMSPRGYGWNGGFGTYWASDPDADMVALLMAQRGAFPAITGLYRDFWDTVYAPA